MKTKLLGVAVTVALLGVSSPVYAQGGWTFTTIDDPAAIGNTGTFAQGINDPAGVIVGYYLSNGFNSDGGFLANIGH